MKFFVASDIHSFFNIFINALKEAGYDELNPEHHLIICGDIFDRGLESVETLSYFKNNKNCTLVRGNHEVLFKEAISRGNFLSHDYSNGTALTIADLEEKNLIKDALILIDSMIPYFETKNYIFVHSWIPETPDWRKASEEAWDSAMWENPFSFAKYNLNNTGKTIVFGHWHTSWYRHSVDNNVDEWDKTQFGIVEIPEKKVIGIDACTAYTGKCNILVIEDELI